MIPTVGVSPNPVTRPCSAVAFVYSPARRPPPAQPVRPSAFDVEPFQPGEVENHPAIGRAVSEDTVPTCLDDEGHVVIHRKHNGLRYIGCVCDRDDGAGLALIELSVEDLPAFAVGLIGRVKTSPSM